MIISMIVACDLKRGIGKENQLPWKLSEDLKNFKKLTMGHHILMGRKTFESIGKALPGRTTLVISSQPKMNEENIFHFNSVVTAIDFAQERGEEELFVVGGANIYQQMISMAYKIYLTEVQTTVTADAFFPEINLADWKVEIREKFLKNEKNEYESIYKILERR
ncbi:MAG: dihydrofolate reductase [Bacteriovoracaceae bacterium]|nr:dihydrofolate reductase [Bacteriovoracaceae bacterium]